MSYDLTLFRPPEGLDPLEAMHRIEREEAQFREGEDSLQLLAELVQTRVPGFRQTLTADGSVELDHDCEVQMILTRREISLTMPYFRPGVSEMMGVASESVRALAERGYAAYDPQLDKVLTAPDLGAMTARYREVDQVLPHLVRDAKTRQPASKPWWMFW